MALEGYKNTQINVKKAQNPVSIRGLLDRQIQCTSLHSVCLWYISWTHWFYLLYKLFYNMPATRAFLTQPWLKNNKPLPNTVYFVDCLKREANIWFTKFVSCILFSRLLLIIQGRLRILLYTFLWGFEWPTDNSSQRNMSLSIHLAC